MRRDGRSHGLVIVVSLVLQLRHYPDLRHLSVTSFRREEIQKEENEDKKQQRDCEETLPAS